jgi:serine palmitoyltransferase
MKDGILITRAKYIQDQEHKVPNPSIRICVSGGHSKKDVEKAGLVIRECVKKVIKQRL